MRRLRFVEAWFAVAMLACVSAGAACAQEANGKAEETTARSKSGKKLFGTAEALRVAHAGSARISPDGARVAYVVTQMKIEKDKDDAWKNLTQLWVAPTAGPASAARQFTRGEKSVGNIAWSPDGKILAFTMEAGDKENAKPQVWFMYADGGEPWQVTKHKSGVSGFEFSPDGATLLLTATVPQSDAEEKRAKQKDDAVVVDHDLKYEHLWTWNIATSEEKQITKGEFTVSDARWSPDGAHVTFTENPTPRADDGSVESVWVVDVASGEKRKLVETTEQTSAARWSAGGKWIAYVSSKEPMAGKHDLNVVSAEGGMARKLTGSFDLNAITPYWAPDGKAIYFSATNHEAGDVFAADVVAGGSVRQLTKSTGAFELSDISKDGKVAVGAWSDPTHPEEVVRTDLSFQSMEPVSDLNAWLADYELANEEVVRWKSSKDGQEIEGVLVKPVDFEASRKWPFLLHPHGGPTGATVLAFDVTSQIMAANGYMQLEPNFRGSAGRGEKFATANENDWGNGDYKDDMSGVQAMVDKGWADPERMGAFGWSYGGYMTF